MQIIIVSRHLRQARTINIMPRHWLAVVAGFFLLALSSAALMSWLSLHWRLPFVEDLVLSLQQQESRQTQDYVHNNLQLMAKRIGELQGKLMQLDSLGQRVAGLADDKTAETPKTPKIEEAPGGGQGGPFLPEVLNADELQKEIDRLATAVDHRAAEFETLEFQLLENRVRDRLLPTTLPVKAARLGSPFGVRADPFAGVQARHEGIDFVADSGSRVVAAADGVVLTAEHHPEFGNMVDIDHGDGLTSRYAHLSRIDVAPGALVRQGEKIGAVGTTGRSTGPHLHFEVRMLGVPQNPALFLKQSNEFARFMQQG
ncbi:MAG: M23 family metallopeptidase [Azonexus sp.]|nr:M23 family metallopeptidase [Azonexus sp.]